MIFIGLCSFFQLVFLLSALRSILMEKENLLTKTKSELKDLQEYKVSEHHYVVSARDTCCTQIYHHLMNFCH